MEHPTIFTCDAQDRALLGISGHPICVGDTSNSKFVQLCVDHRCTITLNREEIGNLIFRPNDFEVKAIHGLTDLLYFQAKLHEDELYIIGRLDSYTLILAEGGYYYYDFIDDDFFYLGYDWTDVTLFCTDYDKAFQTNAKLIVSSGDPDSDDWIAERNERMNEEVESSQQKGPLERWTRQGGAGRRAKRNENRRRRKVNHGNGR
eukprot:TRINITY_DN3879_c0_g1_i1.p1 TRINITY_DN3879_c0_g1~~TRINITY_DN3879_c0_g1_i1.p1  ORF type:complete len:204 (-),score=35.49 TRINITY_DN3879_c0_g1_i1:139-750(-)